MIRIIGIIMKVFPLVIVAVRTVEQASDGWTGEEKKSAAIEMVRVFCEQFVIALPEDALDVVGKVVDALVAAINVIGKFGSKA